MTPIPFTFPYEATFIPKCARNIRSEMFLAHDYAAIRTAEPAEVQVAFRIHFPTNLWERPKALEIMAFDNRLWWPLYLHSSYPDGGVSAAECLNELANFAFDPLDLLPYAKQHPKRTSEALLFRSFESNRDEALALAQRRVWENLCLCDGRAYICGGEPIYIQSGTRKTIWKSQVASLSADRSVDHRFYVQYDRAGNDNICTQEALCRGRFQMANGFDLAAKLRHKSEKTVDSLAKIEVVMPEMIRASAADVRLDALFRLVSFYLNILPTAENLGEPRSVITEAAGRTSDPDSISRIRFSALREFEMFIEREGHAEYVDSRFFDLLGQFQSFAQSGELSKAPLLAAEDEDALGEFAA